MWWIYIEERLHIRNFEESSTMLIESSRKWFQAENELISILMCYLPYCEIDPGLSKLGK